MKLIKLITILIIFSILAFPSPSNAQAGTEKTKAIKQIEAIKAGDPNRPIKDKWALIVGVSDFKNPGYNLKFASQDAIDFATALVDKLDFQADHVKLLVNEQATKKNILSLLCDTWLPRVVRPDDVVVIYFSTHGSPSAADIGKMNFLMAYDSDLNELFSTGISMQNLSGIIKQRVPCDRIVFILDACHSGATNPNTKSSKGLIRNFNLDADQLAQGSGQLVITSSKPNQVSWESKRYNSSVFTKHLIDGLRKNGDRTNLGEAFSHTQKMVQEEVQRDRGVLQTPVLKSKWQGNQLLLASTPKDPVSGINTGVGDIKVMVVPSNYDQETKPDKLASIATKSSAEKTTTVANSNQKTNADEKETLATIDKLPKKFRVRFKCKNLVIPNTYDVGGVFEWNEKKIRYKILWDNGKKGYAHVEKLENNHVVIQTVTRTIWGSAKSKFEGDLKASNKIEGTMGGHDSFTRWSGTWKAWW